MYRVGFGDFFLLSLRTEVNAVQHILVDCGVHAKPTASIDDAIDQLKIDTNGKLALIVMTHRHADHISGFASGREAFAKFEVGRVWMPWFENRADPKAVRFQAGITALASRLQLRLSARSDPADRQYLRMVENITGVFDATGSSNDVALEVLHRGFANVAPVGYYKGGDTPELPSELIEAGLTAQILGPPIDPALIKQMDNDHHQYLAIVDGDDADPGAPVFGAEFGGSANDYDASVFGKDGPGGFEAIIAEAQPDALRAAAAKADSTLNNQSLVVLFRFNGKSLLFAGDAQWGNWQAFLFGGAIGTTGHGTLTQSAKDILGSIDFYKVGHHGSTNATPIDALEAMRNGVVAMCSTAEHAYGCEINRSEVPRKPLMEALLRKTGGKLARSDQVAVSAHPAIGEPLSEPFVAPTGSLFIDYNF